MICCECRAVNVEQNGIELESPSCFILSYLTACSNRKVVRSKSSLHPHFTPRVGGRRLGWDHYSRLLVEDIHQKHDVDELATGCYRRRDDRVLDIQKKKCTDKGIVGSQHSWAYSRVAQNGNSDHAFSLHSGTSVLKWYGGRE